MKVSESWLRDGVDLHINSEQLAHVLTMAGLEVDAVSPVCGEFSGVYVAEVLSTKPHPQADKLSICDVNAGFGETLQIVCGARNVRAGLKVALAKIGAQLPGGFKIKEAKLRGELSQGMLCSASELGMTESSEGILELEDDAPVGMDIHDHLDLNDMLIDIDLTPNRADCFSILGVAREAAALTHVPLKPFTVNTHHPDIDDVLSITVDEPSACPHYCGRVIRGIKPYAQSPMWLKERLRRVGLRSIHPVVDVTNYVMMEYGQPMHAFDLKACSGQIRVRLSQGGERLSLLDGQTIEVKKGHLLITNGQKPLALAGIMGGEDSAVHEGTCDIFFESAFFAPLAVAGVARAYGLCTDSSQRFERGVDPELPKKALERATALLLDIVGGKVGPIVCASSKAHWPKTPPIAFQPSRVQQLTGIDVPEATMLDMLSRLGLRAEKQGASYQVHVPSHRFDVREEVDLVEEIVRLYGYDNIPCATLQGDVIAGQVHPLEVLTAKMSQHFVSRGYHETISYSFVDPHIQAMLYPKEEAMMLANPISPELSSMRMGMWPGLLASYMYNAHRQKNAIQLFEAGVIFERSSSDVLQEHACFSGLVSGTSGELDWLSPTRAFDFYDVKGDLEALFHGLGLKDVQWTPALHDALHPGQSACLSYQGKSCGWVGVLHPEIAQALDFNEEVIVFELRLDALLHHAPAHYEKISKFPLIRRDLALIADESVLAKNIEQTVRQAMANPWLKAFHVFDVYQGEHIPKGKKSLAVSLTLQDAQRTLQDEDINAQIAAILKALHDNLGVTLRE